jgi:enoyl-CoA hydratase/carnithine racemase
MDFETLLFDKEDGLGIITLNRPKSLNGLNDVLLRELSQLMDLIAGDEEKMATSPIPATWKKTCSAPPRFIP